VVRAPSDRSWIDAQQQNMVLLLIIDQREQQTMTEAARAETSSLLYWNDSDKATGLVSLFF
jgi:hypothetical protein